MTGYVKKFEGNKIMPFKISDKQLLKKYNQIWKRVEKLLKIEFDLFMAIMIHKSKNKNIFWQYDYKFSKQKNAKKERTMQVSLNNNARFCY